MKSEKTICKEILINSNRLEVPRNTYQRPLNLERVKKIADEFDERIANPPKVSFRNGRYYVFDGQHTIAARKYLNNNQDLPVLCKVYYGLSKEEEAMLFAKQTGTSAALTSGYRMKALIYGNDPAVTTFFNVTKSAGFKLDCVQSKRKNRIACINTAFAEFERVGIDIYKESLKIISEAWAGKPDTIRVETILGVIHFVELYHGEYDRKRLVQQLHKTNPLDIYDESRILNPNLKGYKKYLYQIYRIYTNSSKQYMLPIKF